jgi:hypothetical protein
MPIVPFTLSTQLHHQLPVMLLLEISLRFPVPFLSLQINLRGEPMDQLIPSRQKGRPALPREERNSSVPPSSNDRCM